MFPIVRPNVNHSFKVAMQAFRTIADQDRYYNAPRGRRVLEIPYPVVSMYTSPRQRVLFDHIRDANPFFHMMEGLWLIAGRNDVSFLSEFNSSIAQYSDNGTTFHGAYGWRLRNALGFDQIEKAVDILRREQESRQAVLQIWNAEEDLARDTKDVPCNDMIFLKIRNNCLHMTVCCRSNDAVWGCYGANVVHFSMLQEYIAARLGRPVGNYSQVSDSLHVYEDNPVWQAYKGMHHSDESLSVVDRYSQDRLEVVNLVDNTNTFDAELRDFCVWKEAYTANVPAGSAWTNGFLSGVAIPMVLVWRTYKDGVSAKDEELKKLAHSMCGAIGAPDWQLACKEWIERRIQP